MEKRWKVLFNNIGDMPVKKMVLLDPELQRIYCQMKGNPTAREVLAELIWKNALEGDKHAVDTILDRTEGKAVQEHTVGNNSAGPFEIIIS